VVESIFNLLSASDFVTFFTTAFSVILASIVAFHFFRFYRIAGLNNLLGMPAGFAFLAASYTLVNLDLWIHHGTEFDNVVVWISFIILSYGFSLIAVSYHHKYTEFRDTATLIKKISFVLVPTLAISAGLMLLTPQRELPPYQAVEGYFAAFNMVILGYLLIQSLRGILTSGNPKIVYIPAAFVSLCIGQFSVFTLSTDVTVTDIIGYHSIAAFIKPEIATLIGLSFFTYALYNYVLRGGNISRRTMI